MYLKQFDLNLDLIPKEEEINDIMQKNNLSQHEALYFWHKNVGNTVSRKFMLETRCIFSFYERLFDKIEIDDFWRVLIVVTKEKKDNKFISCGNVLDVYVCYDYEEFYKLDDYHKKVKSLELLMDGLKLVSEKYNILYDIFLKPTIEIIKQNYNNNWIWSTKKKGKNTAVLEIAHDIYTLKMNFFVIDSNNNCLASYEKITNPSEWEYVRFLGKIKWVSSNNVVWIDKKGSIVKEFTLISTHLE